MNNFENLKIYKMLAAPVYLSQQLYKNIFEKIIQKIDVRC